MPNYEKHEDAAYFVKPTNARLYGLVNDCYSTKIQLPTQFVECRHGFLIYKKQFLYSESHIVRLGCYVRSKSEMNNALTQGGK